MSKEQVPVFTRELGPETMQPSAEAQAQAESLLERTLEGLHIQEDGYEDIARALYVILDPEDINPSLLDEFKIHVDNFDLLHRPLSPPEELKELSAYVDVFSLLSMKESFELLRDCKKLKDREEVFMLSMQDVTKYADRQRQTILGVREAAKQQKSNSLADVQTAEVIASTLDTSSDNLSDFDATRGEYQYANSVISDSDPRAVGILSRDIEDPRRPLQVKWQEVIEEKIDQLSKDAAREETMRKNAARLSDDILDKAIDEVMAEELVEAFDEEQINALATDILDDKEKYPLPKTLMKVEHEDPELFEVCKMYIDELKALGLGGSFVDYDTLTVQELEQFHTSAKEIILAVKEAKENNELSALLVGRIVMDYGQAVIRQAYAKNGEEARNDPVVKWINEKVRAYDDGTRYHTGRLPKVDTLKDLSKYTKEVVQPKIAATQVEPGLDMTSTTRLQEKAGLTEEQAIVTKMLAMDALVNVLGERTAPALKRAQERSIKLLDFVSSNSRLIKTADMPRDIKKKLEWISVAAGRKKDRIASTQVVAMNETNIIEVLNYISELKVPSAIRS